MNMEGKEESHLKNKASCDDNSEDDWEAVADRAPDELLSSQCLPDVSTLTLKDKSVKPPVRRGRGTFSYQKHGLYSDQHSCGPTNDNSVSHEMPPTSEGHGHTRDSHEACNSIKCPFTFRVLGESDVLLTSIPERDLEPPRQRPKTSARTAQRLIAHGMGMKLPSTSFGRKELKEQEEARRQRIISRKSMRDDAWGD